MLKRLIIVFASLIASTSVLADTCNLDSNDNFKNQFTMSNPFSSCGASLNLNGLPNKFKEAFGRFNSVDDLLGELGDRVCSSIHTSVHSQYDTILSDANDTLPENPTEGDDTDVLSYCERHPNVCEREDETGGTGGGNGGGTFDYPGCPLTDTEACQRLCVSRPNICGIEDPNPVSQQLNATNVPEKKSSATTFFKDTKKKKKKNSAKRDY